MEQKQKLQKPKYRTMLAVLDQCSRKNMSKAVFAILLNAIVESLLFSLSLIPLLFEEAMKGTQVSVTSFQMPSSSTIAFSLILMFVALIVILIINYGLFVIMTRMVEKKYVTLGYLFSGFREHRRILKASVIYASLIFLLMIAISVVVVVFQQQVQAAITKYGFSEVLSLLMLVYMLALLIIWLPFTFVWILLYTDNQLTPFKAFKISIRLMAGQVLHFIGFLFAAGGINLLITVALLFVMQFIPTTATGGLQLLSILLSMITFVTEYIAMVRIYLSIPIYFFSLTGAMHISPDTTEHDAPEIQEEQKQLPPSDSDGTEEK